MQTALVATMGEVLGYESVGSLSVLDIVPGCTLGI